MYHRQAKKTIKFLKNYFEGVSVIVFDSILNTISVISWRSVLLVEETGWSGENHRPATSHWQMYHIMLYTSRWSRFELTTSVVIGPKVTKNEVLF